MQLVCAWVRVEVKLKATVFLLRCKGVVNVVFDVRQDVRCSTNVCKLRDCAISRHGALVALELLAYHAVDERPRLVPRPCRSCPSGAFDGWPRWHNCARLVRDSQQ